MPLTKPPKNAENTTIMTSSYGGFGTVTPKESAIWIAPMVPTARSGPTRSARRRSHGPGPRAIDCGDCEWESLMPKPWRAEQHPKEPTGTLSDPVPAGPPLTDDAGTDILERRDGHNV